MKGDLNITIDVQGFIETHLPCPCGTSSNAYSVNADGSGYCFSCGEYKKRSKDLKEEYVNTEGVFQYHPHRGLGEKTLRHYEVQTKFVEDNPTETGFIYPNGAIKIRSMKEKKFWSLNSPKGNSMRDNGVWGKDRFDAGSKKSITITEGEYDALSVFEMTGGSTAAVSIRSASSGRTDCIRDWEYINSFEKIYLCLDNDEPGQKAAREIASLFDFNKVYQVKLSKYKDANEYLQKQEMNDFIQTWKSARRYAPDNIISGFNEIEKSLQKSKEDFLCEFPFPGLTNNLYGMFAGDVILFKGLEGIGKTEIFRALEYYILKNTKHNIGIIHLEEDNATTIKAIAGYELDVPAVLPDSGLSMGDILTGYKQAVGLSESRVHIYSSFETEDEQVLLDNIRFLVSAAGCKFIFLDHISWLGTGLESEDERRKLDRISQKLKLLAKELNFCLIEISHVNDDGKTRGSRNISKVANTVIHLDRDLVSIDPNIRNIVNFTIEKARLGGRTGPAGRGIFNSEKGKLEPESVIS